MERDPSTTPAQNVALRKPSAAFYTGIELFNAGAYWHAHEAWEECWHAAVEPERTFYKGLIQTAAALEQWRRGNARGLWRNWYKARPRLIATQTLPFPLDVRTLIRSMDTHVCTGVPSEIVL